ncbi:MAG: hypothetical protein EXQ99_03545 [Alphaproteobacteria bacterium]|nr:hypothetical protein [Alphaproteobacteria bacterium]
MSERPRAVLTGTSLDGTMEAALWSLAARDGVPALAWIDQWMNLDLRFRRGRPAWVAALDIAQREALKACGFEDRRILLGGHPHLHAVLWHPTKAGARPGPDGTQTVLFVSESYSEDKLVRLAERLNPLGYDEYEVFDIVARAVEAVALARPTLRIDLVVKFHPLEGEPARFIDAIRSRAWPANVRARWLPGSASGRDAAANADLVIGMSSMLLLEALLLERPVLSLTPGLQGEDPFIASRLGAVLAAHERNEGIELVKRALTEPGFRAAALERQKRFVEAMPGDGSARVLAWLDGAGADAGG